MSVWDDLVGQDAAVATLRRAVAATAGSERHAMSHAWLITGPPGLRTLERRPGLRRGAPVPVGRVRRVRVVPQRLGGSHPDVTLVRTEQLSIGVDEVRELARRAAMGPTRAVTRFSSSKTPTGSPNAAPTRCSRASRSRPRAPCGCCARPHPTTWSSPSGPGVGSLHLVTPGDEAVAWLLEHREGIDPALAAHAARAAQGHVGRARVLARDEGARNRRHEILKIPGQLVSVGSCLTAAANIVRAGADEASQATADLDARERAELGEALGVGSKGARPRNAQAALKELDDQQKARAKRMQRDALDRVLTELTTFERDVLVVADGARSSPAATGQRRTPRRHRGGGPKSTPERTVQRIDAILAARTALEGNVAPLLAIEAMLLAMADLGA